MDPIWTPSPERIERAELTRFMESVRDRYHAPAPDYASLHRWSVEYPEQFWNAVWNFCGIRAETRATQVLELGHRLPGARWFTDARLNYAENLLRLDEETPAIIFRNESGERREISWRALKAETARVASGLEAAGVKPGDRVAACMSNLPETVIAMLATVSVGAIWCACSPELGASEITARLSPIAPRLLFAADGYRYAGASIDCLPLLRALKEQIESIEHIVLVPYLSGRVRSGGLEPVIAFDEFGAPGAPPSFTQQPFDHPAFILYSTSADDAPSAVVHGAGGALIQQLKEHVLHTDLRPGERYLYYTTCGWVMWNSFVSSLAAGATIVLFDGAPLNPDPRVLWRIAEQERLTVLGASARFLLGCEQAAVRPRLEFDLGALRTLVSAGKPLDAKSCRYVYRDVSADVHLACFFGGPDIMGSVGSACPILPVYEGELQCVSLGMKIQVYDDAGRALIGSPGELVCTEPFPSLPVGVWGDTDDSRFNAAYFNRYPNAWWHRELATLTSRGGLVIHQRPAPDDSGRASRPSSKGKRS
jgi:acetoacetyl-CoA synthetase